MYATLGNNNTKNKTGLKEIIKMLKPFSVLLLISLLSLNSFSQDIPDDCYLLKKIFGKCDYLNNEYKRPFNKEEGHLVSYRDSITYTITYKQNVVLENQNYLLVIVEAPYFFPFGHTSGYRNFYYFKKNKNEWQLNNSIESDGTTSLGDLPEYELIDIGKNKQALLITFQSTGNGHYEKTKNLYLLTLKEMTFLLQIANDYNNGANILPASDNEDCEMTEYHCTYEVIKSDNEWFDIKTNQDNYGFSKGCKERFIKSKEEHLYHHSEKEYAEVKK